MSTKEKAYAVTGVLFATTLALVVGEIGLRYALNHYYLLPPRMHRVFNPSQDYIPGVEGSSHVKINSFGIRADELKESHDRHILAIGGSTTENLYLDQTESWHHLLQSNLRKRGKSVWVGNAGRSGFSTRGHILQMKYLLRELPEIQDIIFHVGLNDLMQRLAKDDQYQPILNIKDEENLLPPLEEIFNHYPSWKDGSDKRPLYQRTALWEMLRRLKKSYKQAKNPIDLQDTKGEWLDRLRKKRKKNITRDQLPPMEEALKEYERNLNRLIEMARERNIRPILMTQASLWSENLPEEITDLFWLGWVGSVKAQEGEEYYTPRTLREGMNMYNDVTRKVCKEQNVDCIDIGMLSDDLANFYDECHFTEEGASKVAGVLTKHFLNYL